MPTPALPSFSTIPFQRLPAQPNLHPPFQALHYTKENRRREDQNCHPKGIPLHRVAAVVPPVAQGSRIRLVKRLLEDDKTVMPVVEALEAPVVYAQVTEVAQRRVEVVFTDLLGNPATRPATVAPGEEEHQGAEGFLGEARGKERVLQTKSLVSARKGLLGFSEGMNAARIVQ